MNEIDQLKEEIKILRERVAILEYRLEQPVRDGYSIWKPLKNPNIPNLAPPYVVTC